MPETIIEFIVRCVFALAIIIYAILNKTSLSSVVKEIKEVTSMYKIRNKDGSITFVSELTGTVSGVDAAEPVKEKTAKTVEVKATEPVTEITTKSGDSKNEEPIEDNKIIDNTIEKLESFVDTLSDTEALIVFKYLIKRIV